MREIVKYGLVLSIICLIATSFLAFVYSFTKPKIIERQNMEFQKSLRELFSDAKNFELISFDDDSYYKVYDIDNNLLGIAFKTKSKGYSGEIEVLVGIREAGDIVGIKIISQNETPGLGSRITEKNFLEQFIGKNASNLSEVETITSATISSRAVIKSVENKGREILNLIKK